MTGRLVLSGLGAAVGLMGVVPAAPAQVLRITIGAPSDDSVSTGWGNYPGGGGFVPGYGYAPHYSGTPSWSVDIPATPWHGRPPRVGDRGGASPAPLVSQTPPTVTGFTPGPAVFRVRVPADAEIWINGEPTKLRGPERQFQTPDLPGERGYEYDLLARWVRDGKAAEQRRTFLVHAGDRLTVDFRADGREETLPPPRAVGGR